jgi:hypothetical protein
VLHRALEKAVMYSLIIRNPAHGATLPRKMYKEMSVWDESQTWPFWLPHREAGMLHCTTWQRKRACGRGRYSG